MRNNEGSTSNNKNLFGLTFCLCLETRPQVSREWQVRLAAGHVSHVEEPPGDYAARCQRHLAKALTAAGVVVVTSLPDVGSSEQQPASGGSCLPAPSSGDDANFSKALGAPNAEHAGFSCSSGATQHLHPRPPASSSSPSPVAGGFAGASVGIRTRPVDVLVISHREQLEFEAARLLGVPCVVSLEGAWSIVRGGAAAREELLAGDGARQTTWLSLPTVGEGVWRLRPLPALYIPLDDRPHVEISISGFTGEERLLVLYRAQSSGASVVNCFNKLRSTHVVVKDFNAGASEKLTRIRADPSLRHVSVVSGAWLEESLRQWRWVDEEPYKETTAAGQDALVTLHPPLLPGPVPPVPAVAAAPAVTDALAERLTPETAADRGGWVAPPQPQTATQGEAPEKERDKTVFPGGNSAGAGVDTSVVDTSSSSVPAKGGEDVVEAVHETAPGLFYGDEDVTDNNVAEDHGDALLYALGGDHDDLDESLHADVAGLATHRADVAAQQDGDVEEVANDDGLELVEAPRFSLLAAEAPCATATRRKGKGPVPVPVPVPAEKEEGCAAREDIFNSVSVISAKQEDDTPVVPRGSHSDPDPDLPLELTELTAVVATPGGRARRGSSRIIAATTPPPPVLPRSTRRGGKEAASMVVAKGGGVAAGEAGMKETISAVGSGEEAAMTAALKDDDITRSLPVGVNAGRNSEVPPSPSGSKDASRTPKRGATTGGDDRTVARSMDRIDGTRSSLADDKDEVKDNEEEGKEEYKEIAEVSRTPSARTRRAGTASRGGSKEAVSTKTAAAAAAAVVTTKPTEPSGGPSASVITRRKTPVDLKSASSTTPVADVHHVDGQVPALSAVHGSEAREIAEEEDPVRSEDEAPGEVSSFSRPQKRRVSFDSPVAKEDRTPRDDDGTDVPSSSPSKTTAHPPRGSALKRETLGSGSESGDVGGGRSTARDAPPSSAATCLSSLSGKGTLSTGQKTELVQKSGVTEKCMHDKDDAAWQVKEGNGGPVSVSAGGATADDLIVIKETAVAATPGASGKGGRKSKDKEATAAAAAAVTKKRKSDEESAAERGEEAVAPRRGRARTSLPGRSPAAAAITMVATGTVKRKRGVEPDVDEEGGEGGKGEEETDGEVQVSTGEGLASPDVLLAPTKPNQSSLAKERKGTRRRGSLGKAGISGTGSGQDLESEGRDGVSPESREAEKSENPLSLPSPASASARAAKGKKAPARHDSCAEEGLDEHQPAAGEESGSKTPRPLRGEEGPRSRRATKGGLSPAPEQGSAAKSPVGRKRKGRPEEDEAVDSTSLGKREHEEPGVVKSLGGKGRRKSDGGAIASGTDDDHDIDEGGHVGKKKNTGNKQAKAKGAKTVTPSPANDENMEKAGGVRAAPVAQGGSSGRKRGRKEDESAAPTSSPAVVEKKEGPAARKGKSPRVKKVAAAAEEKEEGEGEEEKAVLGPSVPGANSSGLVFALSGFDAEERQSHAQLLKALGLQHTPVHQNWHPAATALLSPPLTRRSDKAVTAMAAGAWLLHASFLTECHEKEHVLEPDQFELDSVDPKLISQGAPKHWRLRRERLARGAFEGLRVHIPPGLPAPLDSQMLSRIVAAGGGHVDSRKTPTVAAAVAAAMPSVEAAIHAAGSDDAAAAVAWADSAIHISVVATLPPPAESKLGAKGGAPRAPRGSGGDRHLQQMSAQGVVLATPAFFIHWVAHPWADVADFRRLPEVNAAAAAGGTGPGGQRENEAVAARSLAAAHVLLEKARGSLDACT